MFLRKKTSCKRAVPAGLVLVIAACFLFASCPGPNDQNPDVTVLRISTPQDLAKIGSQASYSLSGNYLLENDITLEDWLPIGDNSAPFTGVFDGNGKTINLLSFSDEALDECNYLGIFGYVKGVSASAKAVISNMNIVSSINGETSAGQTIGLLAGYAELAEVSNITLSGSFDLESTGTIRLGGIAGSIGGGTVIKNSNSSMTMIIVPGTGSPLSDGGGAYNYIGGITGMFRGGAGIENCHNTGNVTADNTVSEVNGQVFVGGITGGSLFGGGVVYQGYIRDSSSTGTITGKAKGMWTFTGGIAGTIVGGTTASLAQTTRIERCFATGTVSCAGTGSGNPYIGGITGYNYYGALVSQSYFNGTVIADKAGDYTGGIAGYNSQAAAPNNSRIEDCWSAGKVQGFNNAGGIVGQNQINTYIRNCYSIAEIEVTNDAGSVGGIAGLHASTNADSITACVALNPSLKVTGAGTGNTIHRITGSLAGVRSNNYAREDMVIALNGTNEPDKGLTGADGEDLDTAKPLMAFYAALGWNFTNVWKMETGADYPALSWQK